MSSDDKLQDIVLNILSNHSSQSVFQIYNRVTYGYYDYTKDHVRTVLDSLYEQHRIAKSIRSCGMVQYSL